MKKLILAGNPNVGKSVIFSVLSGKYTTVSNYPQTTIEVARGQGRIKGTSYDIVDTPGTNTLIPSSEDEMVTGRILLNEKADALVQVADSKNLKRTLLLTIQLAELGLPILLDLNMIDELKSRGIELNYRKLEKILNIPVIKTVAVEKEGINELKNKINDVGKSSPLLKYSKPVEKGIGEIVKHLPPLNVSRRGAAIMLLEGNDSVREDIYKKAGPVAAEKIKDIIKKLSNDFLRPLPEVISAERRRFIDKIIKEVYSKKDIKRSKLKNNIFSLTSLPVGIPVLAGVLWLFYWSVGYIGAQVMVDFLELVVFGEYINPFSINLIEGLAGKNAFSAFFVGEYGLITMALSYGIAIVLPIIVTFFLVFSLMEDSGYLPRLAALLNRLFKKVGLSGKAVLPMVLGFGCDTMATMVTRILSTKKERIIATFLLALGIPCSAQLGVILAMTATLSYKVTLIWAASVFGVMVISGYLASKLIKGESPDFIMEIPPMRWPKLKNIISKTYSRVKWYLKEVIPIFIYGTAFLFFLERFGALKKLEEVLAPLIQGWLGLPAQTTQAFIIGFFRRDYGAAGLFDLSRQGLLDPLQITVSLITITLFVPCIANLLMIIKERGLKTGLAIVLFIFPFALFIGGVFRYLFVALGIF